ncbi:MAG: hypothetical protein WCK84_12070 [Bacteroidota bacterium]
MKRAIFLLAILCILFGCKKKEKEGGKLECTMTYNILNNTKVGNNIKANNEIMIDRYSQFGDYITSITPSRFVGKFLHIRLTNWHEGMDQHFNIDFFNNQLDLASPQRLADFSNNSSVSFTPEGINVSDKKELIYFIAVCLFLYQEFELPVQYESFSGKILQYLNCEGGVNNNFDGIFIGAERTGCFVKASHENFMAPIFDQNWPGFTGNCPVTGHTYVFGNTDSTFIFDNGPDGTQTNNNPMGQPGYIIRSSNFNPITISAIPVGETKTIKGTMSFNTTDLIQIYAGKDNIPYTMDDYFVYAPNFWERISVTLESY